MLLLIAILAVAEPSRDDLSAMLREMRDLRAECAEFRHDDGSFPPIDEIFPHGVPTDLWDNPYTLTSKGHIRSRGANGIRENGAGDDWGTDLAPPVPVDLPGDRPKMWIIGGVLVLALLIVYRIFQSSVRSGAMSRDVGGSI